MGLGIQGLFRKIILGLGIQGLFRKIIFFFIKKFFFPYKRVECWRVDFREFDVKELTDAGGQYSVL